MIEEGNPADMDRLLPMLERHVALFDQTSRQVAADGGYASGANLQSVKAMGVTDMAFNKKHGLNIPHMAKSIRVYRQLKNFRAGIEVGYLLLETRLRNNTMYMEWSAALPLICLVICCQP